MNEMIEAATVKAILPCHVIENGETIIVGLKLYEPPHTQDVNLALPYRFLSPLIHSLLSSHEAAGQLRAGNPLHRDVQGGLVLDLETASFGASLKKPGWLVMQLGVRGSSGTTTYSIGVDRTRLENLRDAIDAQLRSDDQEAPRGH
jgi:hypothetical protein